MAIALYPGTFDPVTNGHVDIAKRAAALFDKVVVGVYDKPKKNLIFSTQERVDLFATAVDGTSRIEFRPYSGLTVEFARKIGAQTIVRGLRASQDFESEFEMASMNKRLAPDVELVLLFADLSFQFLSSSLLKEVMDLGGDISPFVPGHVEIALRARISER